MVDDEVDGAVGVDIGGVAVVLFDCISESCEVDDEGDSGEVLEDDSCRFEGYLFLWWRCGYLVFGGLVPVED
jgi:hypothetical protein